MVGYPQHVFMKLELSLNKTKIDKLTKENKKLCIAYAKKLNVLK